MKFAAAHDTPYCKEWQTGYGRRSAGAAVREGLVFPSPVPPMQHFCAVRRQDRRAARPSADLPGIIATALIPAPIHLTRPMHGQTMPEILIRDEAPRDAAAIGEVTVAAFEPLAISRHTEQFIVEALRAAGALSLSLVAEVDGRIVGHLAFSPVRVADGSGGWYGLGPVSVLPSLQRQGIGQALMTEGLRRLRGMGAKGCCLVGHPEYYRRFGFQNVAGLFVAGVPAEVFFALSFDGALPQGEVSFHDGFAAVGPVEAGGAA